VASVLLSAENAIVGNVGDSRVYLFRNGELQQISFDDSFVNTINPPGSASEHDLMNNPMRNVLTQAAGAKDPVDVHITELKLASNDVLLLSSDGLHAVIGDAAIRSILGSGQSVEHRVERLVAAARVNGAPDNVSSIVIAYNL